MKRPSASAILRFSVAFTVALPADRRTAHRQPDRPDRFLRCRQLLVAFYFHDLGWHKLKPDHSLQARPAASPWCTFSVPPSPTC